MKCTKKNIEKVFNCILNQLEDQNGRGEFDSESDLLTAVESVIKWFEED
jgi:hypothetical protein